MTYLLYQRILQSWATFLSLSIILSEKWNETKKFKIKSEVYFVRKNFSPEDFEYHNILAKSITRLYEIVSFMLFIPSRHNNLSEKKWKFRCHFSPLNFIVRARRENSSIFLRNRNHKPKQMYFLRSSELCFASVSNTIRRSVQFANHPERVKIFICKWFLLQKNSSAVNHLIKDVANFEATLP